MSSENPSLYNRQNYQCIVGILGIISLEQIVQDETYKQRFQVIFMCDLKVITATRTIISNMHTKTRGIDL